MVEGSGAKDRVIACPKCGTCYRAADDLTGMRVRCRNCSFLIQIHTGPANGIEFKQGDVIGNYRILRRLGQGGMGVVYRAENVKNSRPVAIKALTGGKTAPSKEVIRRFLREARLAAAIRHENVVQVIGFIQKEGFYYIVLEYVAGGSVKDLLIREGTLSEERMLEIALGTARALAEAACLRIVHRDIKPDNIMIGENDIPKLADLGLATQMHDLQNNTTAFMLGEGDVDKLMQNEEGLSLTMSNVAMGTPAYMPPEQASDSRKVDIRSDIYGLGATMYHMICGEPPYTGQNLREILRSHRHSPVPDPRRIRPDISDSTAHIIMRCLAKEKENRFHTPEDLIHELQKALKKSNSTQSPISSENIGKSVRFFEPQVYTLPEPVGTSTIRKMGSGLDSIFSWENMVVLLVLMIGAGVVYLLSWWVDHRKMNPDDRPPTVEEPVDTLHDVRD